MLELGDVFTTPRKIYIWRVDEIFDKEFCNLKVHDMNMKPTGTYVRFRRKLTEEFIMLSRHSETLIDEEFDEVFI